MGDVSPVFEGAGQKRSRPVDGPVLGRGHHAELTLKLAITRLHDKIKTGELVIKSKDRLPHGADAKTALVLGVSRSVVQDIMKEAKGGTVSAPRIRGPDPTDPDDYCTLDGMAFVRRALAELQEETVPNSVPKITEKVEGYTRAMRPQNKDEDEVVALSEKQVRNIMHKMGYKWGAAGHHHVSKESAANLLYRSRYA